MALQRLFRFRAAAAALPVALAAVLAGIYLLPPAAIPVLRYERAAVLAGEAWRLVTAHLVHGDAPHLWWNVAGVLLVGVLFAREYSPRQWLVVLIASTVAIDLGFLLFEPGLEWYLGFSGVLHGCAAAGLVAWLREERDPFTWLVVAVFAAKLAWEHAVGPLPFTSQSLSMPVIHEAHTYGAIGGLVAGLWLTRRTAGRARL
jgi:rhomboid family GlyGly-CTERM serine protease